MKRRCCIVQISCWQDRTSKVDVDLDYPGGRLPSQAQALVGMFQWLQDATMGTPGPLPSWRSFD